MMENPICVYKELVTRCHVWAFSKDFHDQSCAYVSCEAPGKGRMWSSLRMDPNG